MTPPAETHDLAAEIATELPYLRRYARALTGSQDSGDRYALSTLERIVADPASLPGDVPLKVGFLSESFVANFANEWFLVQMNKFMFQKIGFL